MAALSILGQGRRNAWKINRICRTSSYGEDSVLKSLDAFAHCFKTPRRVFPGGGVHRSLVHIPQVLQRFFNFQPAHFGGFDVLREFGLAQGECLELIGVGLRVKRGVGQAGLQ